MKTHNQNESTDLNPKITKYIELKRTEIFDSWLDALRQKWNDKADQKIFLIKKNQEERKGLFSLLLKLLLSCNIGLEDSDLERILYKIRKEEYSISDFYFEVRSLEETIEKVLQRSHDIKAIELIDCRNLTRMKLSNVFEAVLRETSEVYEYVCELGSRGFCQFDINGKIIYANKEMHVLMDSKAIIGKQFESLFIDDDQEVKQMAISGSPGEKPIIQQLQLIVNNSRTKTVKAEIAPIFIDGNKIGGYASITDIETEMTIFKHSPVGIAKANTKGIITYANKTMCEEICQSDKLQGKLVSDIFDTKNYEIVKNQLKKRMEDGLSNEYEVEITRADGKQIPVMITGMSEKNSLGKSIGTLAIFRNIELDKAAKEMHKHIETIHDEQQLLQNAARITNVLVPFELFTVFVYSSDMNHERILFSYPQRDEQESEKVRWRELPSNMANIVKKKTVFTTNDLPQLSEQFMFQGFRSLIGYNVIREGNTVASFFLLSRKEDTFNKKDEIKKHKDCFEYKKLPLDEAVLTAMSFEKEKELTFRLNLIKDISSASNNIKKIAVVIVKRLSEHYNWQHVSIFQVNEGQKKIRLLCQKSSSKAFSLFKGYEQPINAGILGHVYANKKIVNTGDVRGDSKYKDKYLEGFQNTTSELCLPIIMEGDVVWLLNIEDSQKNAISKNEEDALKVIINEIQSLVEKSNIQYFLNSTLEFASDMVIVTDSKGKIERVNPASLKLLGYLEKEMKNRYFKEFINNEDVTKDILDADNIPSDEVVLLSKSNKEVNVLLSVVRLPEEFAKKVFIAKDLTQHKRLEKMALLDKMYQEIATQTKTPLSLVFRWLKKIKSKNELDLEMLEKAIRQLHKVELTYDRLALYNYDEKKGGFSHDKIRIEISEVIDIVMDELPVAEKNLIKYEKKQMPSMYGDIFQLSFCLKTILSYLLRYVPEDEKILVNIFNKNNMIKLHINGFYPELSNAEYSRTLAEMALGEEIVKDFIKQHDGEYKQEKSSGRIEFHIDLPIDLREERK
ncbi:sensory signal transduction histidine kinase [Candidatus Scalindua japonica]|uniref:Sensory signal transduction histidine kinase n=1 Tax=Candidatus Scalindua japonica TaxID=1284222 RepID=A0A286TXN8_9BACT|nr:PAS domain S-box protein [Candidatus Scalindua japonica]GAX60653.1 sensory signal transduction histidine kinase [Candidatus Scalindua japonica]